MWKIRMNIEKERPQLKGKLRIHVYNGTPSSGLMLVDDFMVVAHYLAAFPNVTSPTLVVERTVFGEEGSDLFDMYIENVERIRGWKTTAEITDDNIGKYTQAENPGDDADDGERPK
jgi:hypothetical protein